MSKKIWYSKPLARQWELYLENYKNNKDSIDRFFHRMLQSNNKSFQDLKNKQLNTFIWNLWYSDATKKLLHLYFVDKNLKEFLENLPLPDLDGITKYINENGLISNQGILELKYFPYGIHIPYENKYKAFAFGLMNNQLNQIVLNWTVESGGAWCSVKNYKELIADNTEDAKEITKIFRLAINTIAYMRAFPECVKEGVPEHVNDEESENSFKLEISEKVLETIQNTESGKMVSPHFRKGYFKRLSSDYFKNKKGQIIFVSETMVNGKAKTVYSTEKMEDIKNL